MRLWIWGTVAEDEILYLSGYRKCAGWWIRRGKEMTVQDCEMMNWGWGIRGRIGWVYMIVGW